MTVFTGELARPIAALVNEPLTLNQALPNPAYGEAIEALTRRRQELLVQSPCEVNPSLWDGIDFEEGERSLTTEADRVIGAINECLAACPVLEECEALRVAQGGSYVVSGVLAGAWQDETTNGQHIMHYILTDRWPEGVEPG